MTRRPQPSPQTATPASSPRPSSSTAAICSRPIAKISQATSSGASPPAHTTSSSTNTHGQSPQIVTKRKPIPLIRNNFVSRKLEVGLARGVKPATSELLGTPLPIPPPAEVGCFRLQLLNDL